MGGCMPWWRRGVYVGWNVGHGPSWYRPVQRPVLNHPRGRNPIPVINVERPPQGGPNQFPQRGRNNPVLIAGQQVEPERRLPTHDSYVRSTSGFVYHPTNNYQNRRDGNQVQNEHPAQDVSRHPYGHNQVGGDYVRQTNPGGAGNTYTPPQGNAGDRNNNDRNNNGRDRNNNDQNNGFRNNGGSNNPAPPVITTQPGRIYMPQPNPGNDQNRNNQDRGRQERNYTPPPQPQPQPQPRTEPSRQYTPPPPQPRPEPSRPYTPPPSQHNPGGSGGGGGGFARPAAPPPPPPANNGGANPTRPNLGGGPNHH